MLKHVYMYAKWLCHCRVQSEMQQKMLETECLQVCFCVYVVFDAWVPSGYAWPPKAKWFLLFFFTFLFLSLSSFFLLLFFFFSFFLEQLGLFLDKGSALTSCLMFYIVFCLVFSGLFKPLCVLIFYTRIKKKKTSFCSLHIHDQLVWP